MLVRHSSHSEGSSGQRASGWTSHAIPRGSKVRGRCIMNRGLKFAALAAFGLVASAPLFAQVVAEPDADAEAVITRDVRVLPPDVSLKLRIARTPTPPSPLIVGTYWSCSNHNGHDICRIKLVVCTNDQSQCVEV